MSKLVGRIQLSLKYEVPFVRALELGLVVLCVRLPQLLRVSAFLEGYQNERQHKDQFTY